MATTEIEKLERRYAENPQGLTFAPLAEVHRKSGEVTRALELLRAGLELHPNYIPASIVLGRCHWDMGDLPAAEAAFSHVLRLDDENVIALKSLADISERLGRFTEAQRWLNRLISVDRSNEEARQQLARIESARQQPPRASAAQAQPAAAAVVPAEAKRVAPAPTPIEVKATAAPPAPAEPEPTAAAAVSGEGRTPAASEPPAEPSSRSGEAPLDLTAVIAEPKSSELQFLDTSQPPGQGSPRNSETPQQAGGSPEEPAPLAGLISQEFVPPKDGAYRLHPELTHDYGAPDAAADDLEVETAAEVELQSSGAAEFRVPNAAEDLMDAARTPVVERPSGIETAPPPAYEPPSAYEPPPTSEAPPASKAPAAAPTPISPPEPPRRAYSVRETHGRSVGAFFQSLLAARPPGSSAGRSADVPPAALNPEPPPAPAGSGQDASVSFDDFFGAAGSNAAPGSSKEADSSKDDLDQFQSWLQNLKR